MHMERASAILLEELSGMCLPADQTMLEYAVDLVQTYGLPECEVEWRIFLRSEFRVFTTKYIAEVLRTLREEQRLLG